MIAGDGLRAVAVQGHLCVGEDDGTGGDVPLDGPRGKKTPWPFLFRAKLPELPRIIS